MLEKFSPERKHLSSMPLIENVIWEIIIDTKVKNKGIKRKP